MKALKVELLRGFLFSFCLSIDESRDTAKNIFTSLTVIMWQNEIRDK